VLGSAGVVLSAALIPWVAGQNAAGRCSGPPSCHTIRLPAAIVVTRGQARYRIARTEAVTRIAGAPRSAFPRGAELFPASGTWFLFSRRHLVVGRGARRLWRSREEIAAQELGVVIGGTAEVAFQHNHHLYLGYYGRPERSVAPRELPLGFARDGLYTYSYVRRAVLLRTGAGAIRTVIARRPQEYVYDASDGGTIYFLARGILFSAHGSQVRRMASLSGLGLSADSFLQPLGRLIELEDNHRLVVVEPDGSEFASTALPRHASQTGSPSSSLAVSRFGRAVAFTADFTPSGAGHSSDLEVVYVLRAGSRAAIALRAEHGPYGLCSQATSLQWHGSWLLYSNSGGNLAVIDTGGRHRASELGGLLGRRPGPSVAFAAHWAG
jgi:hypothetical protein